MTRVVSALARPSLVLVEGEAGIGKTRLVREVLAAPEVQDRTVLVAACPPVAEPFPLGGLVDGVRRCCDGPADLGLSQLAGALRPLFPEWADQLPPGLERLGDPAETRHRMLRALTELVDRLSVAVLVVEDAHWADAATLEWLLTLTASDDLGLSVVVTYRPTDVPDGSLLPRLTSRPLAGIERVRIELEPLDVADARTLVQSMLGADKVSEQFAEFLHQHTDGVPLALEETVRSMRERHDIIRQHGTWTRRALDELTVPPTVRDSVLERIDRLDHEARATLQAAAILGEPADVGLLAAVAELDADAGRQGVALALASGLLREAGSGRLTFRHVLDAQAAAEALPASERWRYHHRAAVTLQQLDPKPVTRLARHFRQAGDTEDWCHYAEQAAGLALESGDDHTAVAILLELLTSVKHSLDRRVRLVRKLGAAAYYAAAGLGDLVDRMIDALGSMLAEDDLPPSERALTRLMLGRLMHSHDVDAAVELIEAALPDLDDRPAEAIQAMLLMAFPLATSWPVTRHLEWLKRATEALPHLGSDPRRLWYATHRATALLLLGQESGWEAAAEIPHSASSALEGRTIAHGALQMAQMAITWGRYADANRWLVTATELAEAYDYRQVSNAVLVTRAYLDYYTGAWDGLAETTADLADSPEARPLEQVEATLVRALVDIARGDRSPAWQRLRMVGEEFSRSGLVEPPTLTQLAALGRLHLNDGADEPAWLATEPGMTRLARKGLWLWATDIAPVHLEALAGVGDLSRAKDLVREFADGLNGLDAPAPAAALALCRAILAEAKGDLVDAGDLFADAAEAWRVLPRPYDELLAFERRGRCLLAAGARDKALTLLAETEQRLIELGARSDADRVAQLLREHGVEVARAWRRGRRGYGDQLSPRELDVVQLVAQGMTNKQIADALFISPKTVSRHLTASMRKLGVSSRTALAMTATEAGLLSAELSQ